MYELKNFKFLMGMGVFFTYSCLNYNKSGVTLMFYIIYKYKYLYYYNVNL